ncbi:hypothetical protein Hesp01_59410 [Herbidospora sp. NBRC 101105]|nr:hypothetical protein Hesp01_59410 [Herbidospora sp. NBRC 101105]
MTGGAHYLFGFNVNFRIEVDLSSGPLLGGEPDCRAETAGPVAAGRGKISGSHAGPLAWHGRESVGIRARPAAMSHS